MLIWRNLKGLISSYRASENERAAFDRYGTYESERFQPDQRQLAKKVIEETSAQSSTLLSHVSIMIAVTGLIWAFDSEGLIRTLLVFELVGYLVLALLCIRCQRRIGWTEYNLLTSKPLQTKTGKRRAMPHDLAYAYFDEAIFRDRVIRFCVPTLNWLTLALIFTLLATQFL